MAKLRQNSQLTYILAPIMTLCCYLAPTRIVYIIYKILNSKGDRIV